MHSSFMKDLIEYSGYKPREEKTSTSSRKKKQPAAQVQEQQRRETRSKRRSRRYEPRLTSINLIDNGTDDQANRFTFTYVIN